MSLNNADRAIVDKAVKGTLEQLQKYAPEEYAKLNADAAKKNAIIETAREAATEQVKLSHEFIGQTQDIGVCLAKHLSESRIKMLQEGLKIPTFRMDIAKKSDGKHWVEITREGRPYLEPRMLGAAIDIDWTKLKQYASILVESILLVMSAVGVSVSPSTSATEKAVDEAVHAIQTSSKLQKALDAFVEAWNQAGSTAFQKAKAIFLLIKDSYAGGILWIIIKSLCSNMAWYEWLETAAKVTAMIIAALATDGAALIAEIALVVLQAVDFAKKIANLNQLETIKKNL